MDAVRLPSDWTAELILSLAAICLVTACSNGPMTQETSPKPDPNTTMLMLTGDVMLGRGIDQIMPRSVDPVLYEPYMKSALGYVAIAEEENGPIPKGVGPRYVWGESLEVLERLDPPVRIVNLETAVTTADDPWPGKGIHYRTHPANAAVLAAAGIDCAVVANNHVIDWGRRGLVETLDTLKKSGVEPVGAGLSLRSASEPAVLETGEDRILVFAMADESSGVPADWAAREDRSGVHLLPDLSEDSAMSVAASIRNHA
ncbi:MAG: CapA family protein, partial [Thermoanaerobaculia bacterium]|nr:CapA family protein [Thermoanaerobaculia bacterium]